MPALHTEAVAEPQPVKVAALSVRTCGDWEELEGFRDSWNSLLEQNPTSSIFQTPEWLAAWWQAFGKNKKLAGLIFSDAKGNTVGIAPLYTEHTSFPGYPITTLRLVGAGSGDSDALGFITAPGFEQHCAEAFTAWLARDAKWDICSLETLPEHSLVARHLSQRARESGWRVESTHTPNFVIDLPPTWPQYLNTLESSFRPLLTRYPKRLQSRFSVRIARSERVEDLNEQLEVLFRLHQMRWTGRGEPGAFASAQRRDFYLRMSKAFLQRGWLEFWLLTLDGEMVGAQFCFRYNDTVSLLQEGFHPKYTAEKIGYALRAHVLEEIIRTGAHHYDFLGGSDAYKAKFGARQANYLNLSFSGPSVRGRAYLALQKQKQQFKTWLKGKLPASMLAALGRDATRETPGASQ
ncbi:MAG: GNAT family N-acetyltransferase [Acidobacteriia bacterium]|nr:GNAT family N-acetyltransferase [Terriglobia bacterium]